MRAAFFMIVVFTAGAALLYFGGRPATPSYDAAMEAACEGDVARLRTEIDHGLNVQQRQENGLTLLMCAACLGQADTVQLLVTAGADLNATTPRGWTALMMAATNGHTDVARVLLSAGADLRRASDCGNTALDIAEERDEWEFVEAIAGYAEKRRPTGSRGAARDIAMEPLPRPVAHDAD